MASPILLGSGAVLDNHSVTILSYCRCHDCDGTGNASHGDAVFPARSWLVPTAIASVRHEARCQKASIELRGECLTGFHTSIEFSHRRCRILLTLPCLPNASITPNFRAIREDFGVCSIDPIVEGRRFTPPLSNIPEIRNTKRTDRSLFLQFLAPQLVIVALH